MSLCVSPCVPTSLCVPPVPGSAGLPGFCVHLPPSILHPPSVAATDRRDGAAGWGWGRRHRTGETQRYKETETEAPQVQGSEPPHPPAIHRLSNGSEQSQALLSRTLVLLHTAGRFSDPLSVTVSLLLALSVLVSLFLPLDPELQEHRDWSFLADVPCAPVCPHHHSGCLEDLVPYLPSV